MYELIHSFIIYYIHKTHMNKVSHHQQYLTLTSRCKPGNCTTRQITQ